MITTAGIEALTKPLRRPTAHEARRANKFLDTTETRQCVTCLEWKPLTEFNTAGVRNGRQSYDSYCKPCKRVRQAIWRMGK